MINFSLFNYNNEWIIILGSINIILTLLEKLLFTHYNLYIIIILLFIFLFYLEPENYGHSNAFLGVMVGMVDTVGSNMCMCGNDLH